VRSDIINTLCEIKAKRADDRGVPFFFFFFVTFDTDLKRPVSLQLSDTRSLGALNTSPLLCFLSPDSSLRSDHRGWFLTRTAVARCAG